MGLRERSVSNIAFASWIRGAPCPGVQLLGVHALHLQHLIETMAYNIAPGVLEWEPFRFNTV